MTLATGFVGRRLTEARRARGLSATDFADLAGVSVQSISKYEHGHQTPRLDMLHVMADKLNIPRAYFLRPVPDEDQKPVFWRARLSAPPVARDRAGVRLEWMKEIVDYLATYFDLPVLNLPDVEIKDIETLNSDALDEIADAIRDYWNIRPGPMPDVVEKLEDNGVLVSRIRIGAEKLDAFSQWSDRFGIPFIVLSRDKASAVRQRFDALHELSHIIAHKAVGQKRLNDRAFYNLIEKQADRLASRLLLPAKEFTQELYAPSLDGFLTLKERWGASVGAMIMRCRELEIIDDEEMRRMWINYNRRSWRNGEPLDDKMTKEEPHLIRRGFEKLMEANVQSAADIMTALPFPARDLEELADLEDGTLTGSESRAEPVLKPEFSKEPSNVIEIFKRRS